MARGAHEHLRSIARARDGIQRLSARPRVRQVPVRGPRRLHARPLDDGVLRREGHCHHQLLVRRAVVHPQLARVRADERHEARELVFAARPAVASSAPLIRSRPQHVLEEGLNLGAPAWRELSKGRDERARLAQSAPGGGLRVDAVLAQVEGLDHAQGTLEVGGAQRERRRNVSEDLRP